MLAIGRALMPNLKLLLLDKPSMGLAPLIVKEILRLIVELRDKYGLTGILLNKRPERLEDSQYRIRTGTGRIMPGSLC